MLTFVALGALRSLAMGSWQMMRVQMLCEISCCGRSQISELLDLGLASVGGPTGERQIWITDLGLRYLADTERMIEEAA